MSKTIADIISKEEDERVVSMDTTVRRVVELMGAHNLGAVAVCNEEKVVGVFSERDLLRRVVDKSRNLDRCLVGEVMTSPVYWISLEERHEVAKAIMVDKGVRHLVVMDELRRFQGFVSARQLLEADLADSRELVSKLNDDYYEQRFKP